MTWKDTKKTIKEMNRFELKSVIAPKYVFNKGVFRIALVFCLLALAGVLSQHDFDFTPKYYFVCEEPSGCLNPFYEGKNVPVAKTHPYINVDYYQPQSNIPCPGEEYLCETEHLLSGVVLGTPPPKSLKIFPLAVTIILSLAFLVNHLIFNIKWGLDK